jgi:hypothetical protein
VVERAGFAPRVAVLQDEPLPLVDGIQSAIGQQPVDEFRFEDAADFRAELLLLAEACSRDVVVFHESRFADAVHSLDAKWGLSEATLLDVERFLGEACSHSEKRSPPSGAGSLDAAHSPSPQRLVDEALHCAAPECYSPQCRVEERCSLDAQLAYSGLAELRHDLLQDYKVLLLVWPVHRN